MVTRECVNNKIDPFLGTNYLIFYLEWAFEERKVSLDGILSEMS